MQYSFTKILKTLKPALSSSYTFENVYYSNAKLTCEQIRFIPALSPLNIDVENRFAEVSLPANTFQEQIR